MGYLKTLSLPSFHMTENETCLRPQAACRTLFFEAIRCNKNQTILGCELCHVPDDGFGRQVR